MDKTGVSFKVVLGTKYVYLPLTVLQTILLGARK